MLKDTIISFYDKHYRKLLVLPMLLLILSILQIAYQVSTTGDFVNKGTSLKGGSIISISTSQADVDQIQSMLRSEFPQVDVQVRSLTDTGSQIGIAVESSAQTDEVIVPMIASLKKQLALKEGDITVEVTGSALGNTFFKQTFTAMIIAFMLMALVVFVYFRTFVPSIAVVLAAFSDIIETVAIFNLMGMQLTTAGIAAFLMLIGYSVDTDILLTTRVLKRREGTVMDRIWGAYTTGMTMIMTTFAAALTALIFTNSPVVRQIMIIVLIGLVLDAINTWVQNAAILKAYAENTDKSLSALVKTLFGRKHEHK